MSNNCNIEPHFWGICFNLQQLPKIEFGSICFSTTELSDSDPVLFTISHQDDFVILSSNEPYINIQRFNSFSEDIVTYSGIVKREFRWGLDDENWSDWLNLNVDNLNKYIRFVEYKKFFIEFKYTLITDGLIGIRSLSLDWDEYGEKWKQWRPFPKAYAREKNSVKYPVLPDVSRPAMFNPYSQNPAIKLQKDLSFVINNLYGHDISYFRSVPDKRSQDVIWNEYSLSNVLDPKQLKVIVPNNEFPDNKFNFNAFGAEFEMPFEIHIDRRYFEHVFGQATHPGKRDVIVFDLANRMYEISSVQLVRDFMQEPIYYKISLVKYQVKSSRLESQEIKDKMQDFTQGFESIFGNDIKSELKQISNNQQTEESTSVYDPIREWTYPKDFIVRQEISNFGTVISEYHYDLGYLYEQLKEYTTVVKYKAKAKLPKNNNLAYTCWFQEKQSRTIFRPVSSISKVDKNEITITFDVSPQFKVDQWVVLSSSTNPNFELFGQIQAVNIRPSGLSVTFRAPNYILSKAETAHPNWKNDNGLIAREMFRRNFLHSYDEYSQKGIRIDSLNSKYFRISLNDMRFWFEMPVKLNPDVWYGMVFNLSKLYQEISMNLYTIDETSKSTILKPFYESYRTDIYDAEFDLDIPYSILASNLKLTNIRILSEKLDKEKQSLFLNMNVIRDAHLAHVIDNCIPRLRSPYIGNVQ